MIMKKSISFTCGIILGFSIFNFLNNKYYSGLDFSSAIASVPWIKNISIGIIAGIFHYFYYKGETKK
jgi:hypothetical protein